MGAAMRGKLLLILVVIAAVALFFTFDLHRYFTIAGLQAEHSRLVALYHARPALFVAGFMAVQVAALTFCLPGAVVIPALAAGAIFGTAEGSVIVLLAVTLGDSLGFLAARYLLRDWVRRRYAPQAAAIDRGIADDGALYLLALRLMAIVPFFVVNVTMALTRLRLRTFAPVSLVGLVPATVLHVNAGTALSQIHSAGDIASLRLVLTFAALGLTPVIARLWWKRRTGKKAA